RRSERCAGVTAPAEQGKDMITGGALTHAGADGAYHPGDLTAWRERQGRAHLVLALHHEDVEEVATDGADVDRHLSRSGLRIGKLQELHVPRLAPLRCHHRLHARTSSW